MKNFLILLITFFAGRAFSQDIKAAYIQLQWSTAQTYSVSLYLFTDSAKNINRPSVPINFGDATTGTLSLSNTTNINGVSVKKYSGLHAYPGPGQYYLFYTDTFRIAGIKNIANSQTQKLSLTTKFTIDAFMGPNSNPTLQNFPIYFGVTGNNAFFDPNFTDSDGDSLSYPALIPCYITNSADYYFPSGATLNNKGIVSFSKDSLGLYCFSYQIFEWRKNLDNNYQNISWSVIDFSMDITTSVGISENKYILENTSIYPNPTSNEINISFHKNNYEAYSIEILNSLGETVLKTSFLEKINISNLPKGLYVIRIIDKSIYADSFKIIKD